MMNNESTSSPGKRLIQAIKEKKICKDHLPNTGKEFHGGYEELYLYTFKLYESSVSRYILNQQITEEPYNGL